MMRKGSSAEMINILVSKLKVSFEILDLGVTVSIRLTGQSLAHIGAAFQGFVAIHT